MVKFVAVAPEEIPNFRESHRGRVSYPILKSFLETALPVAMLDRTGIQQSMQGLNSCLTAYIRSHELPIKLFNRAGQIYLARTDLDEEGNLDPANNNIHNIKTNKTPVGQAPANLVLSDIPEVSPAVVDQKFLTEKDQTTK